mmetsp:Transcript_2658/g.4457  ORF Transcript_2658/g.4457 Transcript_2658/m.4457 type:complete len:258 (-) Transcript_2658:95-868(-)
MEASRSVVEASLNNMCKAYMRSVKAKRGEQLAFSDNMQYFIMYVLGILKSQLISIPMIMNQTAAVDKLVYQRFLVNMMSPDEMLALVSPQFMCISDRELNDQNFPALEVLERQSIRSDGVYLLYNSFQIYLYIGRSCDPFFIYEFFRVQDLRQIDRQMSEDEMFELMEESAYMKALYNIIQQVRDQRQPFTELYVLIEGEVEAEQVLQSMCILDELANHRYKIDFNKFMAKLTQQSQQPSTMQAVGGSQQLNMHGGN